MRQNQNWPVSICNKKKKKKSTNARAVMFPLWNTWISTHSSHSIGRKGKVNKFFMSVFTAVVRSIISWKVKALQIQQPLKSQGEALKLGVEDVCGPVSSKVLMLGLPKFLTLSWTCDFYLPPFIQAQTIWAGRTWVKLEIPLGLVKPPQCISEWVIARQERWWQLQMKLPVLPFPCTCWQGITADGGLSILSD